MAGRLGAWSQGLAIAMLEGRDERMIEGPPPVQLALVWDGDLRFSTRIGSLEFVLDGRAAAGPTPVQALAAAIAGCMAIDLVHILSRSRRAPRALAARLTAFRAATDPKRLEKIALDFAVTGDASAEQVERAIALSREKYCSVWQSMRNDIDLEVGFSIVA
jgi:putative redox protein